ncbi:hypothetical protein BN873_890033 [Candidatus Competibacter denitrificans Run_A_D11]|uniref:Uncharacterized protein n=1 Tax=Candidatus Competibacter denitrificans Run_A_D11 TaxID=1400863 RepID=W6M9A6_9GAMM|nr:hypothetical protein [Candidatus Competibacter denitrificans]CDI04127.1 hypothetical protein BN873_890033 [Candidatus Competibacter denitrificans Run_A_D11]HRC69979.1 hypothetical protein [Candidatus Competibacter denitrificans]
MTAALQERRLESRYRTALKARADWLESLEPGDSVHLVVSLPDSDVTYAATVGSICADKIMLFVAGGFPGAFVWRQHGCYPPWHCYIKPVDANADDLNPLTAIKTDWSAA